MVHKVPFAQVNCDLQNKESITMEKKSIAGVLLQIVE
jgi:hypothetical protein